MRINIHNISFGGKMKFKADICTCENTHDKILSVCQCGVDGDIEHEVIIQRGPKEYDMIDDALGPKITCDDLGLDLAPGPEEIIFSGLIMTIVLSETECIEVDISGLDDDDQQKLRVVAKELFK